MAVCAHSLASVAIGQRTQQPKQAQPISTYQPPCKLHFGKHQNSMFVSVYSSLCLAPMCEGSAFDVKFARREMLFSSLLAVAAPVYQGSSLATPPKDMHLPIEKIKDIIENDIRNGQYYITGDLTKAIYEDDCRFVDPTTDIQGVDKYVDAVRLLFDPKLSHHELKSIDLVGPNTIQVRWKLEGYLKFPWHPHIQPYEGTTLYKVNEKGLIASHEETWDISLWTALLEFLTPTWKEI